MFCQRRVAAAILASPSRRSWRRPGAGHSIRALASTTKDPPRSKENDDKLQSKADVTTKAIDDAKTTTTTPRVAQSKEPREKFQRFKQPRRKDPKKDVTPPPQRSTPTKELPVIQPSIYYYCTQPAHPLGVTEKQHQNSGAGRLSSRLVLPAMNASALLDPLKYCKTSSRLSQNRSGVSRSISGTDAARRLLRGKKEFILAVRSLKQQPSLLEGHGVPPQLFQHCIDMADALLLQYSPDVVECTFHNYNYVAGQKKLPNILRIRSRDATNRCSPWPPENTPVADWDYHLELYLTVMERLACNLGQVLQQKHFTRTRDDSKPELSDDSGDDGDELTSSPFLFPNSNIPQWNVDILRGSYFDLHRDGPSGTIVKAVPPMPIVEFTKESATTGHVLIRLQGHSVENSEFGLQRSKQPVTMVFDARFPK